jgi:hypothetical protein
MPRPAIFNPQEIHRTFNGVRFVGAVFEPTQAGARKLARLIRHDGARARSAVVPGSRKPEYNTLYRYIVLMPETLTQDELLIYRKRFQF